MSDKAAQTTFEMSEVDLSALQALTRPTPTLGPPPSPAALHALAERHLLDGASPAAAVQRVLAGYASCDAELSLVRITTNGAMQVIAWPGPATATVAKVGQHGVRVYALTAEELPVALLQMLPLRPRPPFPLDSCAELDEGLFDAARAADAERISGLLAASSVGAFASAGSQGTWELVLITRTSLGQAVASAGKDSRSLLLVSAPGALGVVEALPGPAAGDAAANVWPVRVRTCTALEVWASITSWMFAAPGVTIDA